MKANIKRILALALAAVLALGAAGEAAVSVYAAETEPEYEYTDSYVLTYEGSEEIDASYQDYCKPYLYASPHISSMSIRNLDTGAMVSWYCSQQVYNMINTSRIGQGGTGAYASVEVYCIDACINASGGSSYRRINLEDSTYFDDETAGRIRAVFKSSFPYIKDMSVITENVNNWLAAQGGSETAVSNLTAAEVVTATQYTIWALANGSDVVPQSPYSYTDTYTAEELASEVVYVTNEYMDCTEGARETTENNIILVQRYLENLAAQGPSKIVASENVLEVVDFSKVKNEDGTYDISISYAAGVQLGAEDDLVLTASCSAQQKNIQLTADNLTGTIELTGVASSEDVVLEINGYQMGGDVYLFDATGDRSNSQSMVGYDASVLPVHAEVVVESADHIINIYKTSDEDDGEKPLAGIVFDIYKVASMADLASGKVTLSEKPTAEDIAAYKTSDNLIATLTTDAAGFATYNFTENGMPDGVYLIVERPNSAIVYPVDPFFVAIPGTSADGTANVNAVKVYPKNTVETGPDIKKDVTKIENNEDTFDVGQTHTWIIRGGVPAGIGEAKKYVITDTLDHRLTYKGNMVVKVGLETDEAGAEAVTLTPDTDYTVTVDTAVDADGNQVDHFVVSLTDSGFDAVAAAVAAGTKKASDYEIRIYFDAIIDTDAQMGQTIPNQAELEYVNSTGMEYDDESDIPVVYTGGTNLLKVDSADQNVLLPGASFKIARDATEAELLDESVAKEKLTVAGTEHTVVFVSFYASADLSGEKVSEVTTDDNGSAVIYGLAYGEYYIVETKAPAGYNLLNEPIVTQIDADSHTEESIITVYNAKFDLPETGGMGTAIFTMGGAMIIAGGIVLLFGSGKKKKA